MSVLSYLPLQLFVGILLYMSYIYCAELLPLGSTSVSIDDESLKKIRLSRPLDFFDRKYNDIYISDDGVIVFNPDMEGNTNKPQIFPYEHSVIAPLWHDFDGVELYYREITANSSQSDLLTASNLVKKTHPDFDSFEATWAMVITWVNVTRYYDQGKKIHTFQAVLVANENATFVIFLYGNVPNAGNAQVGVNAGHCNIYYSLCISMTDQTNDMMDVRPCDGDYGVVGFRIDDADRDQSFYMCTPTYKEDRTSQCECSSLDLPASEIVAQKNNTRVGAILSYSCAKGYVLIGDDEMACWYNGIAAVWDGYEYGCKKLPQWVSPSQKDEYATVTIREDAPPNSLVFQLQALAGDGSSNITYSFEKQTPGRPLLFDLFDDRVRVAPDADLDVDDRKLPTTYILHFRAKDKRYSFTDKLSADAYLIVYIKDTNDNAPMFIKPTYSKTIEGDKKIGSFVMAVTATDKDVSCPYNEIHYQFVDESLPGYFSLDPWDGTIKLIKQPNYTQYDMTIKATDGGNSDSFDAARVTIYVNKLVTTTTTTPVPEPVAMTTPASAGLSTAGVVGILVAIVVVLAVGVVVYFYRRHLRQKQTSVSASFKHGNANVVLDNPNFVPNSSYIDDHSFSQPVHENSTNTSEAGTEHDSHCDTQVLTTESWRKEKERVKVQS